MAHYRKPRQIKPAPVSRCTHCGEELVKGKRTLPGLCVQCTAVLLRYRENEKHGQVRALFGDYVIPETAPVSGLSEGTPSLF